MITFESVYKVGAVWVISGEFNDFHYELLYPMDPKKEPHFTFLHEKIKKEEDLIVLAVAYKLTSIMRR